MGTATFPAWLGTGLVAVLRTVKTRYRSKARESPTFHGLASGEAYLSIEPATGSQADVPWELECLMLHSIGPPVRPYVTESSDPVSSSEAMESRYSAKTGKW